MPNDMELICVGAIAGAFGVRGEVRLKSFTSQPEDIVDYSPLLSENGRREFEISLGRVIKNGLAVRIDGVATKEQADALRGMQLFVARDRLPNLPDDEFYHADLIGLDVFDTGGTALGRVIAVQSNGADDLLEIRAAGLSDTVLLPFSLSAVPTVDLTSGRIIADPPDGLFPDPKP